MLYTLVSVMAWCVVRGQTRSVIHHFRAASVASVVLKGGRGGCHQHGLLGSGGVPRKVLRKKKNWCIWVDSEDLKFQFDYYSILPLIILGIHDWVD